jgi:hypothetical protein
VVVSSTLAQIAISRAEEPMRDLADSSKRGSAMAFMVQPSARAAFTLSELTDAYEQFKERAPQPLVAATVLRAAAYRFGGRVLFVYQESEGDAVIFIHPTS